MGKRILVGRTLVYRKKPIDRQEATVESVAVEEPKKDEAIVTTLTPLTATVSYERGRIKRVPHVTAATIMFGQFCVASRTMGGRYSQDEALREFFAAPSKWTKGNGWDTAYQLGKFALK